MKKATILLAYLTLLSTGLFAQSLSSDSLTITVDELPEYLILISEMRGIGGGISLAIEEKGSPYESELNKLEQLLERKEHLDIGTQIDLLNAMFKLGYEYVDAYTAGAAQSSLPRTGMVFRKKEAYRK